MLRWACLLGFMLSGPGLWAIEVESISSRTQRLLDQADALLEDGQWNDAIETLSLVMQQSEGQLVSVDPLRHAPLSEACQARLARLPGEALAGYRQRIDPTAFHLLEAARNNRDPKALQRILTEFFVSTPTAEAILLLADLAIEQGDYGAARGALERLHPLLTGPTGRPIGVELIGIDLDEHWPQVEAALKQPRTTFPAVYPDADDRLAEGLARLAVISLQEQDFERAAIEIDLLRRLSPEATGRLAGRDGPLAGTLDTLLLAAHQWPATPLLTDDATLGGNATRSGAAESVGELVGPIWSTPLELTPPPNVNPRAPVMNIVIQNGRRVITRAPAPEPPQVPTADPIVYGPWLLLRNGDSLIARDLLSGKPAITPNGVLYTAMPSVMARNAALQVQGFGFFNGNPMGRSRLFQSPPSGPLEIADGVLFARVGPKQPVNRPAGQTTSPWRIVGLGLRSEGLEVADLAPPESPWRFSGPPLVEEGVAYVALDADEVRPRIALAAYATATGKRLWLTPVCSGEPEENPSSVRPPDVLTKFGQRLYLNTNLGAVAAVAADSGRLEWVVEYPRRETPPTLAQEPEPQDVSPCVYHRGRVLASPVDSTVSFALDAATGRVLWALPRNDEAPQLLGARGNTLIAAGRVVTAIDINTGHRRYQWPESTRAGIRGMGRGCLAGDEVFWPTRDRLYTLDVTSGQLTRPPLDLSRITSNGANLVPAHGLLVVAGPTKLTVLGPYTAEPPPEEKKLSSN